MVEIRYSITPVDEMPPRRNKKGSKYDPILDAFMAGSDNLVTVEIVGKDAYYIRMQLNNRINARNLRVKVSAVNNRVYLEKL